MSILVGLQSQKRCTLEHRVEQLYTGSKLDWFLTAFHKPKIASAHCRDQKSRLLALFLEFPSQTGEKTFQVFGDADEV